MSNVLSPLSELKLLITGVNGFLGSEIVRQAIDLRLHVRATDKQKISIFPDIDYHSADILDLSSLKPVVQGVSCVIHVAGLAHIFDKTKAANAPFKEINEIGTVNVVQAAANAGVKHFILISSVSVYGPFTRGIYDESAPCSPEGKYAESKYQSEQRAIEIAQKSGMALTILRLATLYGEGDPGNVARLMKAIDRGRFVWVGNGSNRKSLLYKGDAALAVLAIVSSPASGINIYNVSAPPCAMREVVEGLASAQGRRLPTWHIPASLILSVAKMVAAATGGRGRMGNLPATLQKWLADDAYSAGKFEKAFNFQTQTSLAEGLRREVEWYRGKGK